MPPAQAPGSAVGGGISVYQGQAAIRDSQIFGNRATGGGVYNLGAIDAALATLFGNLASTSDNNCFGC
ncbi:MAG: hypothetical protein J5I93_19990 [Pirellulaceae bacterium]|nr:hypothetical protein [Pirellulaceae bacterium]